MSFAELFIIAVGLSMDAFAVAVSIGLEIPKISMGKPFIVGLYFGAFQAAMPLAGYMLAALFADMIIAYDHWVAFAMLSFIGGRMIAGSFKKESLNGDGRPAELCAGNVADKSAGSCTDNNAGSCTDNSADSCAGSGADKGAVLAPSHMLPLAVATSIDALAAGVSFAFLRISILPAVLFIGAATFAISSAGVKAGSMLGSKPKLKAELAGGIILVLMGLKILADGL